MKSIVFYATRAGSGANRQPWEFVVVTDRDTLKNLARPYRDAVKEANEPVLALSSDPDQIRILSSAVSLAERIHEVPALIVVCVRLVDDDISKRLGRKRTFESELTSVLPAVQNLLLAARAYGLGAVFTAAHRHRPQAVRSILHLPDDVEFVCAVPIGFPVYGKSAFAPLTNRRPVDDVLHWNRF